MADKFPRGLHLRSTGQADRRDQQQRTERDRRPIKHDAQHPVASARHAPDVVERRFDVRQHHDGDIDQHQHADDTERAAARVLNEFMDAARGFFLHDDDPFIVAGNGFGGIRFRSGIGESHGGGEIRRLQSGGLF